MNKNEFSMRVVEIKHKIFKIALGYLKNEADAEDAVAQSMYNALKNLRKLKEDAYFDTWLVRILINVCKDELRRKKRFSYEEIDENDVAICEKFDSLELSEAICLLPHNLKSVVTLRYFGGYTQRETAEILNIPQGSVATYGKKALAILRLEMSE